MSIEALELKLSTMLDLQESMNDKVNPDWRNTGNEWYRAIWVEAAELLDHYGWKWWKKQDTYLAQVHLELIDIWHFGLSSLLESVPKEDIIAGISKFLNEDKETLEHGFKDNLEFYVLMTLSMKAFNAPMFLQLCEQVDLSFDDLYKGYVGKNVLNFFRQDNGYKAGTYRKHWYDGREDNEHLVDILNANVVDKDLIYTMLQERYNTQQ